MRAGSSAVATSNGLFAYRAGTGVASTLTIRTRDGQSSGWAGDEGADWSTIESERIAEDALRKCHDWRGKTALEPGKYEVVLEPTAVGMLLSRLPRVFDARQADEGRSYFSKRGGGNRVGEKLFDARVTIVSNPAEQERRDRSVHECRPAGRARSLGRERRAEDAVVFAILGDEARRAAAAGAVEPDHVGRRRHARGHDRVGQARRADHTLLVHPRRSIRAPSPTPASRATGRFSSRTAGSARPVTNFRFNQSLMDLLANVEMLGRADAGRGQRERLGRHAGRRARPSRSGTSPCRASATRSRNDQDGPRAWQDEVFAMQSARDYFDYLNHAYLAVHKTKEDLFWATYMATSDDHDGFARAESAYKEFIGDPAKLAETREQLAARARRAAGSRTRRAAARPRRLAGASSKPTSSTAPRAARCMREIVDAEAALFEQKRAHEPRHLNEHGEWEVASLPMLATNLATNRVEERRRSSFDALPRHRALGARARLSRAGRAAQPLRARARLRQLLRPEAAEERAHGDAGADAAPRRLHPAHGRGQRARACRSCASSTATTPRRPGTSASMRRATSSAGSIRTCRSDSRCAAGFDSFRRLGIQFRGATMQLDLLERPGKHQNGFCHGPVPSWVTETGRVDAGGDQLHRRSQTGSGRQRHSRDQHALPRRRPRRAFRQRRRRTRRASRRSTRRRRWPMRRRSRCSATAGVGCRLADALRDDADGARDSAGAHPRAHRQQPADARLRRARRLPSCPTSSRRCTRWPTTT